MKMRQLTVVARTHFDLIADITGLMADSDIDIRHMDSQIADQDTYLKLVVSEYDKALSLLTHHQLQVRWTQPSAVPATASRPFSCGTRFDCWVEKVCKNELTSLCVWRSTQKPD